MPIGIDLDAAGEVRAGVGQQAGLGRPERHGQVRAEHRAVGFSGVGVHAAGNVAGHHEPGPGASQRLDQLRGGAAEPALRAGSQHRVNDDVGAVRRLPPRRPTLLRRQADHPAAGLFQGREPFGVGLPRGEDRRRPHAAAGQQGGGEQPVPAVVALAGEHRDAGAVEALPRGPRSSRTTALASP